MEAFWEMLKSEMYYLRKFNTYTELEFAVIEQIDYYNNHRVPEAIKMRNSDRIQALSVRFSRIE